MLLLKKKYLSVHDDFVVWKEKGFGLSCEIKDSQNWGHWQCFLVGINSANSSEVYAWS